MKIKVEKDIPLKTSFGRESKYPFRLLEIGDSFQVPVNAQASVRRLAWSHAKLLGRAFAVRKEAGGLYRCWRVEHVVKIETQG